MSAESGPVRRRVANCFEGQAVDLLAGELSANGMVLGRNCGLLKLERSAP